MNDNHKVSVNPEPPIAIGQIFFDPAAARFRLEMDFCPEITVTDADLEDVLVVAALSHQLLRLALHPSTKATESVTAAISELVEAIGDGVNVTIEGQEISTELTAAMVADLAKRAETRAFGPADPDACQTEDARS